MMNMKMVGVGTRTLNFLIDSLIVGLLAYAAYKVNTWYAFYYRTPFFTYGYFFFAMILVYYTIAEGITGRTVGKMLSYSKVVKPNGTKPGFGLAFIRSLIRLTVIDLFFIPFYERPLHDVLTKTYVVEV